MSIEKRVMGCIVEQIGCSMSDLEMNTSLEINLGFDNLDFVELLMALEDEFDSTWNGDDYNKNCHTVGELTHWVKSLVQPPQSIPDSNVDALETHSELAEEQTDIIAPSVSENVTESGTDDFPVNVSGLERKLLILPSASIEKCPLEQIKQLCSDHNVNIEISNKGEIYIHIENIDNTYKVCDMKQLTQVLDSVKLLESFKED